MKPVNLNGANPTHQAKPVKPESNELRGKNIDRPVKIAARGSDEVKVSSQAEDVSRMVTRASELPDIRQDKVDSLRQLILSGRYRVSSQNIADAIMKDEQA
jgi:flagellar biosynthesis anti-sigma factor FlgM